MPKRNLSLTIARKGRAEDVIDLFADPDDVGTLRDALTGWLAGNKWHPGRWGEFEAIVRYDGEGKVRRRVRAS
jgi:hypothetical protein